MCVSRSCWYMHVNFIWVCVCVCLNLSLKSEWIYLTCVYVHICVQWASISLQTRAYVYVCVCMQIYIQEWVCVSIYTPTPPLRAGCDTRSIFKPCKAGMNSEFSFSLTGWLIKAKEPSLPFCLIIVGSGRNKGWGSCLFWEYKCVM